MGEIGGNDYNFWFLDHKPREVAYQFIPDVVASISSTVQVGTNHHILIEPLHMYMKNMNHPTDVACTMYIYNRIHAGAHRSGREDDHDPGELPDRVRAGVPERLPERQPGGLRRVPLPPVVQRLLRRAQPGAAQRGQPAQGAAPGRQAHLRRLLRRRPATLP